MPASFRHSVAARNVGAAVFAVGAALGALLPATRREDELMGEHSDAAKAAAEEAVAEGAEKAKTMAAAAVKGAKERVGQEAQARSGDQPGGGADERPDQRARGAAPLAPEKASADDRSMPPAGRRATPQSDTNQPHQQPTRKKGVGSG